MNSKALFTRITQVAMVVRDCEATARRYVEDLGIGPWEFYALDPSNTPNMTLHGRPVEHAFRTAIAEVGDVQLELIQPLSGESLYAQHLAAHGEGLHHVAFAVDNFRDAQNRLQDKGYRVIQAGRTFDVARYAYFDTDTRLGCIAEIGSPVDEGKVFPAPTFTLP